MATAANALVVMTKAPEPGRSKTRLVPPLTYAEAADLARALLADQLENLARFAGARRFIAFTPATAAGFFAGCAAQGFQSFAQRGDDLGERMANAFGDLFARGFGSVVLIGGDLPAVPLEVFERAYAALASAAAEVVLGPSADGGYYLIGMNRLVAGIFDGIVWSRADVLARTREKCTALGLSCEILPAWYDIDKPEDLERLWPGESGRGDPMKNTLALLQELRRRGRVA